MPNKYKEALDFVFLKVYNYSIMYNGVKYTVCIYDRLFL